MNSRKNQETKKRLDIKLILTISIFIAVLVLVSGCTDKCFSVKCRYEYERCCDGTCYNPMNASCCNNNIVPNNESDTCCKGKIYDQPVNCCPDHETICKENEKCCCSRMTYTRNNITVGGYSYHCECYDPEERVCTSTNGTETVSDIGSIGK